jgi:hypothetical protein
VLTLVLESSYKEYKRRKLKKDAKRVTVNIRNPRKERYL